MVMHQITMSIIFKIWIYDTNCKIHVNPFEYALKSFFKKQYKVCTFGSCLTHWVCLEPNGNISPCDKSFGNMYLYENVANVLSFQDIISSFGYCEIIKKAIIRRNKCKEECQWYIYCNGGCNHDAFIGGDVASNNHYYCEIYKKIFEFINCVIKPLFEKKTNYSQLNPFLVSLIKS